MRTRLLFGEPGAGAKCCAVSMRQHAPRLPKNDNEVAGTVFVVFLCWHRFFCVVFPFWVSSVSCRALGEGWFRAGLRLVEGWFRAGLGLL